MTPGIRPSLTLYPAALHFNWGNHTVCWIEFTTKAATTNCPRVKRDCRFSDELKAEIIMEARLAANKQGLDNPFYLGCTRVTLNFQLRELEKITAFVKGTSWSLDCELRFELSQCLRDRLIKEVEVL